MRFASSIREACHITGLRDDVEPTLTGNGDVYVLVKR